MQLLVSSGVLLAAAADKAPHAPAVRQLPLTCLQLVSCTEQSISIADALIMGILGALTIRSHALHQLMWPLDLISSMHDQGTVSETKVSRSGIISMPRICPVRLRVARKGKDARVLTQCFA